MPKDVKKIIVAEDLKPVIENEKGFLGRSNITIFPAVFTDDVFTIHKAEKVDLIIADHGMPGMCIDDMCSQIRMKPDLRKVSIILICSNSKSSIERCKASGANAFLLKPVNYPDLLAKAREFLEISERESLRVLMRVSVKGQHNNQFFFSTSQNISETGVLIETEKHLDRGDRITCSFFLRSGQVNVEGEVMRVLKRENAVYQYGIRFLDLTPEAQAKIDEFVRTRHH